MILSIVIIYLVLQSKKKFNKTINVKIKYDVDWFLFLCYGLHCIKLYSTVNIILITFQLYIYIYINIYI